ncbi:helix-turn-helix domain-containing protein [Paenibacillus agaridevorans]|uniref:helix-turn-helix domain-containing protein n=1 Tax=Paenibacillus agaridevorans TaxID=171404 RepID=UPI001BE40F95|nr:helix-turn-helix domain-containing protein [Paenibacillus agaridevorans]
MKSLASNLHQIFFKHLASYMILLMLPVIVLGGLINLHFINSLEDEILTANLNKLDQVRSITDDKLQQLYNISMQISLRRDLGYFHFTDDPLNALNASKELRNYLVTDRFFYELFLYHRGDDYIYSSSSSIPLQLFEKKLYQYDSWSFEAIKSELNSLKNPKVRAAEGLVSNQVKSRVVTFLYPLSSDGFTADRTLMVLVSEQALTELLRDANNEYTGNTYVLDKENQVVASLLSDPALDITELVSSFGEDRYSINDTVALNNNAYLLSYIKSDQTNWKYITIVPKEEALHKINDAKLVFLYTAVILLLFGACVIWASIRLNYSPIYNLKKYSDMLWGGSKNNGNELDAVKEALDYLSHQNRQLNVQLLDQSVLAQDYFLFNLFKGTNMSEDQIKKQQLEVGLRLDKSSYQVAIFYFHLNGQSALNYAKMKALLEVRDSESVLSYVRDDLDQQKLIMLINFDQEAIVEAKELLERSKEQLQAYSNSYITMGVSGIYGSPTAIPKSYLEAMSAIDYRLIKGIGQSIYFEDNHLGDQLLVLNSAQIVEKLGHYIKQSNQEQIELLLNDVIISIKNKQSTLFAVRMVCFDIIHTAVRAFDEINRSSHSFNAALPNALLLKEFETIDELVEIVKSISREISDLLERQNQQKEETPAESMTAYIQENFTNPDFSVVSMAEVFQMSQAYLSQYYKEQTGSTILEYDTFLKMEKAKQLLSSTKLPLKDVSLEVGYYNVTSFIRRFKQVTGATPGEYRKQNSKYMSS